MAKVHADASHSTAKATIEGSVWEVVFQGDEMYFTLAMFPDRDLAEHIADRGNSLLWPEETKRDIGFEVREHRLVLAATDDWTRQDFLDEIDGWEIEDYFKTDPDPDEEAE